MSSGEATESRFTIDRTSLGCATILCPNASMTYEGSAELRTALDSAAEARNSVVVVDCRQVKAIDSEALELLADYHENLQASGCSLKLVNLNDVCTDILTVTGLVSVFSVCNGINEAIRGG